MRLALALAIIVILLGTGAPSASAQGSWTVSFDFRLGKYYWQEANAPSDDMLEPVTWEFGTGFINGCHGNINISLGTWDLVAIRNAVDFPETVTITGFQVSLTRVLSTGSAASYSYYRIGSTDVFISEPTGSEITQSVSVSSLSGKGFYLQLRAGFRDDFVCPGGTVIIHSLTLQGTGDNPFSDTGLYEPLAEIDPEFGIWDYANLPPITNPAFVGDPSGFSYPDENLVIAMSQDIGDLVYAVAPGEVLYVQRLTRDEDCFLRLFIRCYLSIDVMRFQEAYEHGMLAYFVNLSSIYKVGVSYGGTNIIEYFVEDAPRYVSIGLQIDAGCILGKTTELVGSGVIDDLSFDTGLGIQLDFIDPEVFTRGAAFLRMLDENGDTVQLLPLLTEPVDPGAACNADPALAACIGDPELNKSELWETQGSVQWIPGGGAVLRRASSIKLSGLNLNPAIAYSLTVTVKRVGDTGSITLRLGTTNLTNIALTLPTDQYEIPADIHTADQSPLYSAQITNTGQNSIEVLSFCVTDGTPNQRPNTCYFVNYSFDDGISRWTVSGAVVPGFSGGEIVMPDGSTISQNVRLYPDGSGTHNYELYVIAKLVGGSDADMTSTAQFLYQFPSSEAWTAISSPADTDSYAFGLFHQWPNQEVLFSIQVPISSLTEGTFSIGYEETRGFEAPGIVTVKEVCLNDPFAHHPTDGGGSPPFRPVCNSVSVPTTDELGEWIFYHWSQLDRFFQCDLMVVLNRIFATAYATYEFIQWQTLYWQAVASGATNWATKDMIYWVGGHFANIANGRTTTIIQQPGGGTCNDIGCIISQIIALLGDIVNRIVGPIVDAIGNVVLIFGDVIDILGDIVDALLNLLNAAFSLMFTAVTGLLTLIFGLITVILSFFSNFIITLESLATAINSASPRPIPGVPQCQLDPQSSAFCAILWALENTIFSGEGALFIPLIIGAMSIHLLLWSVSFIKRNLTKIGDSV